jgi:hypothetical protein
VNGVINGINFGVQPYLRAARDLHKAGKRDEAWSLLTGLLTGWSDSASLIPMVHADVYKQMRVFLQRERRFDAAVKYAVLDHLSYAVGLFMQRRRGELRGFFDSEVLSRVLHSSLAKAKSLHLETEIVRTIQVSTESIADMDLAAIGRRIDEILRSSKEPRDIASDDENKGNQDQS